MSYTVLIFGKRKAGLSFAEFKDHYENKHIPLMKRLLGDNFPDSHTRHYVDREANPDIFMGAPADFPYDVVSDLKFRDKAARDACLAVFSNPEVAETIAKDEEAFADRKSLRMIDVGVSGVVTRDS